MADSPITLYSTLFCMRVHQIYQSIEVADQKLFSNINVVLMQCKYPSKKERFEKEPLALKRDGTISHPRQALKVCEIDPRILDHQSL